MKCKSIRRLSILVLGLGGALSTAGGQTPEPRLYVPSSTVKQLRVFAVDASTGSLSTMGTQATHNQPFVVAATPDSRFLYVGHLDGTIDGYSINGDGTLTAFGAPYPNAGSVQGLAMDPEAKFLYAGNATGHQIRVFSIDQTTGRLTALPDLTVALAFGAAPHAVLADGNGHLYVALAGQNTVAQFAIDSITGALSQIGAPVAAGSSPDRLAIHPSGTFLYVGNYYGTSVSPYTIAPGTGALAAIGAPVPTAQYSRPRGVAVHPNGQFLFVTYNSSLLTTNNVAVFAIDGAGSLTQVATATAGSLPSGVVVDPSGTYVYVCNQGSASITRFAFDPVTGQLTATDPGTFPVGAAPQFPFLGLTPQ